MDFIHVSSVSSATVPEASGDGQNSVFLSNTVFGDTFGDGTLAVTVILTQQGTTIETEADIVVNNALPYDSYRGVLQPGAYDLHRILFHEFGHVFGLAHVQISPPGQFIMEPVISDLDHPVPGDTDGVRYLYGASFYQPISTLVWRIGIPYSASQVAPNNNPTSITATGLPPGMICNLQMRFVGTPTMGGVYSGTITSHGPITDVSEGFRLTVLGPEQVPGLLSILPIHPYQMIGDPIRPRAYFISSDGIGMFDTDTFAVTMLTAALGAYTNLSLSADASTLIYVAQDLNSLIEHRIDLTSLISLPDLPFPGGYSPVLEGLDGRSYVAQWGSVAQFDTSTGNLQATFALAPVQTDELGRQIALSPDRTKLYLARTDEGFSNGAGELSSWDVSTATPKLLQKVETAHSAVTPSRDSKYLYTVHDGYDRNSGNGGGSAIRTQLPAVTGASFATSPFVAPAYEGLDGRIFQGIYSGIGNLGPPSGDYLVYDPVTLEQTAALYLGNLQADLYPNNPGSIVFDNAGKYIFANIFNNYVPGGSEVWVYSSDFASYPPPLSPTKTLANISTRARVESGENAMIGGFIIAGTEAKQVVIRGLGPSLPITGALSDPILDLYDSTGKLIATNDDWANNELAILSTLLPPGNKRESAISITLDPGAYTAIVHAANNQPGLSLVEVYDLDQKDSVLANISTRGDVESGDNVMIGGFIIGGTDATNVLIRAIGPSLASIGVAQPLSDPILEIHDSTGKLIISNDNWRSTQEAAIEATGIPPKNDLESAVYMTLDPGAYTAIVRGQDNATGVALVEVYNLDASAVSK